MIANYTEIIINADISAFGFIENKYRNIKLMLNEGDKEVEISIMLQNEEDDEAVFINLNKVQCIAMANILETFANHIK